MYIKITNRQAAQILAHGGRVWDGCDPWAGCVAELAHPPRHWRKARALRALTRWAARSAAVGDGWYIYHQA